MRRSRRPLRTLAATAVTALALAFPPTAGAAAGDVTFTPDPVVAGHQVSTTVSADGVQFGSFPCRVSLDDTAVTPDSCVQVEGSTASVTFTVPPDTVAGSHTVSLLVYKSTFTGPLDVTRLVPVPELRPLGRDRALAAVEKAGLQWCPAGQDSGYVVDQSPVPGTQADQGTCVTVTLADGVVVPNLRRLRPSQARAALAKVFLTLDAPAGNGRIAEQDPQPGATVPPATVVTVTFAVPPPPSPTTSRPAPTKPATVPPQPTPAATTDTSPNVTPDVTPGITPSAGPTSLPASPTTSNSPPVPWPLALGVLAFLVGLAATSYVVGRSRAGRSGRSTSEGDEPRPGREVGPVVVVRARPDHRVRVHVLDDRTFDGARIGVVVRDDAGTEPVLLEELP